ncbi:NAD-dependent succinate-semialdehyde dehydrogenase [Sinorhizobium alkalisoli]|uniref:NAD-dependent succinate-semialdehyde dehydrogenase n=1 Tax=Sinorhizobium alkalisoli TaxID=1752398 RepID=A0A1E3VGH4_9HYPH|nr:NAD-dependent succinate-semialdehyde dehydrogenase [Sinorhizobium alkalisoli]MCG5479194.1 NAD-dependent succinate-semialdehyde dehydrogenase [Sinorhizobium alkalisoli]ODR92557.1 NAD-dependent succinate-semialdehyde dehydrogenase [Sinorhizobium alkalisoli]
MNPTPAQKTTPLVSPASAAVVRDAPTQLFIGGDWVSAKEDRTFEVVDPSTGDVIATVSDGDIADGISAVDAAEKASEAWKATPPRRRSDVLMKCFHLVLEQAEWLAQLITVENGKALADARSEVSYAAEFFRWYAEEAVRAPGEFGPAPSGANQIIVNHEPIGIAVLVTPWNFPAAMATRKMAPALAAGCTCILKPAAETPLTALAIGEIMRQAGVPAGVLNIVTTKKAGPVVSAMLHDKRVRKLSFTGSTGVGRTLLREAADQVVSCSMELGGNAPFIVFDDADLETAVAGAMVAKMRNGGEACTAANRFYVQKGILADFTRRFAEEMAALKVGPGLAADTQLGPLITEAAVAKVERLVDDAVAKGARLVTGGSRWNGDGFYYPPTVLADVSPGAEILREEIFGPVAPVIAFETEDEVVRMANDTEYGLVSYVFSSDLKRALAVAGRLESGMVGINRGVVSDAAAPFGGMKQSGLGREGSHHGMLEYLETKYIAASW